MHQPLLIIPLFKIIPRMRTPTLRARQRRRTRLSRIGQQVAQLERLDEVAVPNQGFVGDAEVRGEALFEGAQGRVAGEEGGVCAEDGRGGLHGGLHRGAECGGGRVAGGGEEGGAEFADGGQANVWWGEGV